MRWEVIFRRLFVLNKDLICVFGAIMRHSIKYLFAQVIDFELKMSFVSLIFGK